jgi:hypothetical protein
MRATSLALALLGCALLAVALPAEAHVHTCIKGSTPTPLSGDAATCGADQDHDIVVGWLHEPAVTGQMNGLDLGVHDLKAGTWVENLTTLGAQYQYGGASKALSLEPQDDKPGWYTDAVLPTKEGTYSVQVNGTVGGHTFSFTVQPEAVDPASDVAFPRPDPTPSELSDRITALEQQVQQLKAGQGTTQPSQGGVGVTPEPTAPPSGKGVPGFEPLLLVAGLGGALVVARRR